MVLGSENAIILLENELWKLPVRQNDRIRKGSDQLPASEVGWVPYGKIKPRIKGIGSNVSPSLIQAIVKCKEEGKTLLTPGRTSVWKTWITILAKTSSKQLELHVEVLEEFMKNICNISRNPLLHLQGKVEVGLALANNLTWSPFYSTTVDGCLRLSEVLISMQNTKEPQPPHLKALVPIHAVQPWETWTVKFMLDVAVEWPLWPDSISFPVEIEAGSASEIMKSLYENDSRKDVTISVGNGAEVKCHSFILEAHSSTLAAMLSPANGMQEAQTGRIEMNDISEEAMSHLLRYFYGMKIPLFSLNCDVVLQLFQFADKYKLPKLEYAFTQLLLAKSVEWFTPNVVLELYYYAKNLETLLKLREHALRVMAIIPEKVKSCERFKELDPVEAVELAWKLITFVQFK